MKKKMAIISSTDFKAYPMGGMMSFILDSLEYLEKEYDITLWGVNLTKEYDDFIEINSEKYKFKSFSDVKIENKIIPNFLRVTYNIYRNRNKILRDNYDILYIHGIPLSFPFFNLEVKVVNHIHGTPNPFSLSKSILVNNLVMIKLYETYRRYVIKKSDLLFLASDRISFKDFSQKYNNYKNKIKHIPNFADSNCFQNIKKHEARNQLRLKREDLIFVTTGRLSIGKDHKLMIDAFNSFLKKYNYKNIYLYIIGDGDMYDSLQEQINNLRLDNHIILLGKKSRTEISIWLNSADLFLFTSKAEGYPISLAESAMCSLPIVSTDISGVHDLVINEFSGYLVKNRNPEEFAKAIGHALESSDKFSKNIYSISSEFSPDNILNIILNHFRNV